MVNNETIGQTAEYAVCKVSNIQCYIDKSRISDNLTVILEPIIDDFLKNNNIPKIIKSLGYINGKVDFELEGDKTLSLKTLKKPDGKICPQKHQPTLKSWDKRWNKLQEFEGKLEKNNERFEFIKDNIRVYLKDALINTYCCDYLILISNCNKQVPNIELMKKPNMDFFDNKEFMYTREFYIEPYNQRTKKNSEFSTTIKLILEEGEVPIGEFQFHKSSRLQVKFRFNKKFLKLIL